jgi:hypothetical protein
VLEAKWYQDSDGNAVPDFIEVELGYDPLVEDCPFAQCGEGLEGSEFIHQERNTLLVLDSSGSMAARLTEGTSKLDAAKRALKRYSNVISNVTNMGFLVYGHKGNNTEAGKAESCPGIELLAPLGQLKPDTIDAVLDQFQPTGWTPIAAALTAAGEAFAGQEGAVNRIVLVSDGIETCGGDPVAVAKQLKEQGLDIVIDVIGFDIEQQEEVEQLRAIATATGGQYYDAKTRADLDAYTNQQFDKYRQTAKAAQCSLRNASVIGSCNFVLFNKSTRRIGEEQRKLPYDQRRFDALTAIRMEIEAEQNVRSKAAMEALQRSSELSAQWGELLHELNRAYGQ